MEWSHADRTDRTAVWAGVGGTVILHLLLLLLPFPDTAYPDPDPSARDVEFVFADMQEEETWRFVETNPDVPTNEPDQTDHIAARDQQAAQPDPASNRSPDNIPELEGEEPDSPKIVDGDLADPEPAPPPGVHMPGEPSEPSEASEAIERFDATPLEPGAPPPAPDFLEEEPRDGEGLGSWLEPDSGEEVVEEASQEDPVNLTLNPLTGLPREPQPDSPEVQPGQPAEPGEPRPRPRVRSQVAPGPLMERPGGVTRAGAIAIDANFSEYGDYLQRMFDAVALKWNQLNQSARRSYSEVNSRVVVEFEITREGEIRNLQVVHTSADRLRTLFCEDAIKSRAPYGAWTKEMVDVLGDVQAVRFTFLYR